MSAEHTRNRIIRAFWHRTRKEFVPLTVEELCRRAGLTVNELRPFLSNFSQNGMARTKHIGFGKGYVSTWELLPKGQDMATAQMEFGKPRILRVPHG